MRLDWSRVPRTLALIGWAAFFDWLWLTDEAGRYVGPRTSWVVPFGAIVLTATALFQIAGLRGPSHGRPSVRETLGMLALVAPLVFVAAAPASSLGSLAVDRKRSSGDAARAVASAPAGSQFTLYDVASAEISPEFARIRKIGDGTPVKFDGFVSEALRDDGTLELSRFLASCCAADAMPYSVDVRPQEGAPELALDDWVLVTGKVAAVDDGLEVVAERVEIGAPPSNPYGY